MNCSTKINQQHDELLRVFYMFIFMTLLVVRNGLDVRNVPASCSFTPYDDAPLGDDHLSPSQADQLDRLYAAALALLYAAELVARQLVSLDHAIYELMKRADVLAQSLRGSAHKVASQHKQASARLDSS